MKGFPYRGKFKYFLTICAETRAPAFERPGLADAVASQFLRDATAYAFAVPAYVIMPDHAHLLVEGLTEASALRPFINMAKQRTGYAYRQSTRQHLWQRGFYDVVLRDGVEELAYLKYLVENPVREGLVTTADDYPWWGSGTSTREEILRRIGDAGIPR